LHLLTSSNDETVGSAQQELPQQRLRWLFVQCLAWGAFGLVVLVAAEFGSRLDDWFFDDVPMLSDPSYEALFMFDEYGNRRGVPHERWKKVRLNNLGMRGPDVTPLPRPGCTRWMFLGASETFGEPSMLDAEYPARVRALVAQGRCVDVLNTAFPGFDLWELISAYHTALAAYRPDVVFVYPPTHFYLGEIGSRKAAVTAEAPPAKRRKPRDDQSRGFGLREQSRFFQRLLDSTELPPPIQKRRVEQWIAAAEAGKPSDWHFEAVPEDRLRFLEADLRELIDVIRASGAQPVLMTHAVRTANPPRAEDERDLFSMRVYVPRASEKVLAGFEYAAADWMRRLGAQTGTRVIDVARRMNGRRELFIDLVHFTETGHKEVAHLIHTEMVDEMSASAYANAVQ
jgi:hypothetical protein